MNRELVSRFFFLSSTADPPERRAVLFQGAIILPVHIG